MVNVLVRHKVSDFDRWKKVFDDSFGMRKSGGELNCRIFYNEMDESDVILFLDWETLEKAKAFFSSDPLKKGMQAAGVSGQTEVVYLDEIRSLRRTAAD